VVGAGAGSCGSPAAAAADLEGSDSMVFAKLTAINHSQVAITGYNGQKPRQFASIRAV
jgi:uncharacterized protein involved in propanediol utilization